MSATLLVLPSFASLIRILIMAELVAVVAIYIAEVPPRRLYGDAASRDTS